MFRKLLFSVCLSTLVACFLVSVLMLLAPAPACAAAMSAAQARGKQIYFSGTSPSGEPITAYFGEKKQELPGQAATCGSCHGHDGTGRPESGLIPTNITWKYLIKSYGHIHASGLAHGPFDEAGLKRYLKTGVYPGDKTGDPAMPLYTMPEQDLDDLLAYLKRLGELFDPGLGEGVIKVGSLIPGEGPPAAAGAAIRDLLAAYFSDLNKIGGIYGRKIELMVHEIRGDRQTALARVKDWLAEQQPFALVSTFTPDAELDVQAAAAAEGIPLVGPFTLYPTEDFTLNRQVFYLFAGLGVQARALIRYAGERLELSDPQSAVLYPEKRSLQEVIAAVEQACKAQKWPAVQKRPFAPGAFDADASAGELQAAGTDLIVFLGVESRLRSFLDACVRRSWVPVVLAPGVLAGRMVVDAPPEFEKRLYLAYPTLPQDRKDWATRELSRLMQTHNLGQKHLQAVISAYCAAKILTEAIRLAGRDLDRTKFAARLEKFYQFDTGLTPPITFTRNRRIGAKGAYVLGFDPQMRGQGGVPGPAEWVELN
jgi:ABC-type branched-subunit amino acid transport system substrate-binding protein/cytochrome c553